VVEGDSDGNIVGAVDVGMVVGSLEDVGNTVGDSEGVKVNGLDEVGDSDGDVVGPVDWCFGVVGVVEGDDVGGIEGYLLGDFDGNIDGPTLGTCVLGFLLGEDVGVTVGNDDGIMVWSRE